MDNLIGPLLVLPMFAGSVCVVLASMWLLGRAELTTFRKIALAFMCAGAIVPLALISMSDWINRHEVQDVAIMLWPTSFMLMAFDATEPLPWSTIAFVIAFSIVGNVGTYGIVGLIVSWFCVRCRPGATASGR